MHRMKPSRFLSIAVPAALALASCQAPQPSSKTTPEATGTGPRIISKKKDGATAETIKQYPDGHKVRITEEYSWQSGTIGRACNLSKDVWEEHSTTKGTGNFIYLYHCNFLIGTFDGASYSMHTIQLPEDITLGKWYNLRCMPAGRKTTKDQHDNNLAPMKPGELTAILYGNPDSATLTQENLTSAKIQITEKTKDTTRIHLIIKAKPAQGWDFNLDKQYTLTVTP